MSAVLDDKIGAQPPTTYDTHPDRYVHWRLAFDGERATLSMDVSEDKGIKPGYKLKLNSIASVAVGPSNPSFQWRYCSGRVSYSIRG